MDHIIYEGNAEGLYARMPFNDFMKDLPHTTQLHQSEDLEEDSDGGHVWGVWFHDRTGVTVSYSQFCYQNVAIEEDQFLRATVRLFGKKKKDIDGLARIIERAEKRFKTEAKTEVEQDSLP